jgi:hypothetical protein
MNCDKIWSLPAAQKQLSIGTTKMFDLIKRGEIKTFRWETRQFIRDDELRRFIARISGAEAA